MSGYELSHLDHHCLQMYVRKYLPEVTQLDPTDISITKFKGLLQGPVYMYTHSYFGQKKEVEGVYFTYTQSS